MIEEKTGERNKKMNKDKQLLTFISEAILERSIDTVFAVREIYSILESYNQESEVFKYFSYLESELEKFPSGRNRGNYSSSFLVTLDKERDSILKEEEELYKMCKQLISSD